MKTQKANLTRTQSAFTLIELLVVIAVIGILAALLIPTIGTIKINAIKKRVQGEMKFVESAINAYYENLKVYPAENPANPALNPLYYELAGTKLVGNEYQPLSGVGNITQADLTSFFGAGVTGFFNVTRGSDDELRAAKNCLSGLRPAQYLAAVTNAATAVVLGTREKGALMLVDAAGQSINPWRYQTTKATNNPGRYDLWVDVIISGKNYRFCNWSEKPLNF